MKTVAEIHFETTKCGCKKMLPTQEFPLYWHFTFDILLRTVLTTVYTSVYIYTYNYAYINYTPVYIQFINL